MQCVILDLMPAYYADTVLNFQNTSTDALELQLTRAYESDRYKDLITAQITSWREQIAALKRALYSQELSPFMPDDWGIAIEFIVPRRMGRIDTVLLVKDALIVLEFKTQVVDTSARNQVEDYCLDLLHFHALSHNKSIHPVVIGASGARLPTRKTLRFDELRPTEFKNVDSLAQFISFVAREHLSASQTSITEWNAGEYHPVPTIIEAALAMYADMDVDDIARSDSDPINLTATTSTIRHLAEDSLKHHKKTICFVTGVPGAGKTLAGLKVVHDGALRRHTGSDAVFLTGNLPLVHVLSAALAQDMARRSKKGLRISSRSPKTTIQTILGYKKGYTKDENPPHEKIVVFDEAQRAWNAERTAEYLENNTRWVNYSEPELMMAILDRHPWALLVALVGGGQEINRGEAGLPEWGRALENRFRHWDIALSPQALTGEYGAGARLFGNEVLHEFNIEVLPSLHLDNPTRQFRGKTISRWAEALLEGEPSKCRKILTDNPEYPIYLTRDLGAAKTWLRPLLSKLAFEKGE